MKDIIFLVSDKNMEFLLKGLLPRIPIIENIDSFSYDILIHSYRDPGIVKDADSFLRNFINKYSYAIVIFDYQGCGITNKNRSQIEEDINHRLSLSGWEAKCSVICIDPELENWIWVNPRRIAEAIEWQEQTEILDWLHQNQLKNPTSLKPTQPKESFEALLKKSKTPRSSSIYESIASTASYRNCIDPAFHKLLNTLKDWYSFQ
ncbi:MAG TPA: hypothetical protein PLA77_09025 [Bacteroidales bacterium]|nr:hypothetical protein [Bacteroidales bacterium]